MKSYAVEVADKVLAKASIDRVVLRKVVSDLRDDVWPLEDHVAIFRGLRMLALEGAPVDAVSMLPLLPGKAGEQARLKFLEYLEEITAADADYWIARLLDTWRERQCHKMLADLEQTLQAPKGWAEKENQVIGRMRDWVAGHNTVASGVVPLRELIVEAALTGWERGPGSGLQPWDDLVAGFPPGTVHILAGRPGVGKTTLGIRVCEHAARKGVPSLMVPLEMGELVTAEWCGAMGVQGEEKMAVIRTPDTRWPFVRRWIEAACEQYRPAVVVVDHLLYLTWPNKERRKQQRNEELAEIIRDIKMAAREIRTALLVITHLNRAVEYRQGGRPTLADIRDCGEIEQVADSVSFLWCKKRDGKKARVPAFISVEKNRLGPPADVAVWFHRPTRTFEARTESEDPAPEAQQQ